ncbi:septum formation initiator family protein [Mycobacterium sp.]|uniref:FtsB family cell division protein n=1 Tax=Mycobacterium sp. TaxID=1785 RepID=UPI001277CF97|nr:septum formation initiator family protein [Mycobacterium sp.]KAA8961447.1 MAG: septum formation initiator family protein [Mycobacterium sp.]
MPDAKRPDPKRRTPAPRRGKPGKAGDFGPNRPRKSPAPRRRPHGSRAMSVRTVKRAIAASAELRSDQRLGLTARRAAILAAVVCVLTLTVAGPVRTYFGQRTEMKQLAAAEAALRRQIAELEQQKARLADPAYIAAQARERLGFVRPGEIPYQVQLPATAAVPARPGSPAPTAAGSQPWYTALWHTIADAPHGAPAPAPPDSHGG